MFVDLKVRQLNSICFVTRHVGRDVSKSKLRQIEDRDFLLTIDNEYLVNCCNQLSPNITIR